MNKLISMNGCDCLKHIDGRCAFLEYFHKWVWVGVTV